MAIGTGTLTVSFTPVHTGTGTLTVTFSEVGPVEPEVDLHAELVNHYVNLLAFEFWEKPKANAEVTLLAEEWADLFDFYKSFEQEFNLDNAYGDRLVKIAALVGQPLVIDEGVLKTFFGFALSAVTGTFSQAPMFSIINDSGLTSTELSDGQLRLFIRARIAKNSAAAVMVSDTQTSIQAATQLLFNNRAFVVNNFNMWLTYYVDETVPEDELLLIINADLLPTPQGVGARFIVYREGETFGFANNSNAKTFGAGIFARLVV